MTETELKSTNKYGSIRTYSNLCQREFASKLEARRAEELALLERAGEISDLQYQVKFTLSKQPRVTITIDFAYVENRQQVYQDTKGVLTRDFRTKLAWLKQLHGVDVNLTK